METRHLQQKNPGMGCGALPSGLLPLWGVPGGGCPRPLRGKWKAAGDMKTELFELRIPLPCFGCCLAVFANVAARRVVVARWTQGPAPCVINIAAARRGVDSQMVQRPRSNMLKDVELLARYKNMHRKSSGGAE